MYRGAHIAVVVPAYNEARLIGRTLASIPSWVDQIVVVDDASQDDTLEQVVGLDEERSTVLRHTKNEGVGAAIATGYRFAFQDGAEIAVVMAGDGQMDPADLPRLLDPVVEGRASYVKGDRLGWPGVRKTMPPLRWLGNHLLSALTRAATGLEIGDSQCGYTAISREAAEALERTSSWRGYGYPNDFLGTLACTRLHVVDVPVRPIYGEEESGIRPRHVLVTIPMVLARVTLRRWLVERGQQLAEPERFVAPFSTVQRALRHRGERPRSPASEARENPRPSRVLRDSGLHFQPNDAE